MHYFQHIITKLTFCHCQPLQYSFISPRSGHTNTHYLKVINTHHLKVINKIPNSPRSLLSSPHTFYTYLSFTPPTPTKCPSRHNHFVTLTNIICLLTVTLLTLYLIITPCVATQDVTPSSRQRRDRFTHLLRYLIVISFPFLIYER